MEAALEVPTRAMPTTIIHSVEEVLGVLREILMGQGDSEMLLGLQLLVGLVEAAVDLAAAAAAAAAAATIQIPRLARRQLRHRSADRIPRLRSEVQILEEE